MIGETLGPYRILEKLGEGGMGEVYKARDTRLDRTVAIKVLPPDVSGDAERRARFEREAKTIAGLNHSHICTLYDVGHHDGAMFLVMEHLAGETLAGRLARGRLPLEEAVRIAGEIGDALAAAHRQGVIHRDLKPGNVMLTAAGAKLLDFGLAKTAEAGGEAGSGSRINTDCLTIPGTRVGTAAYMSPEQVVGDAVDARTDIFSFGVLFYEMLSGRRAFSGGTVAATAAAILGSRPPELPPQEVPPVIERIVQRCLAKDPAARFQSADDLVFTLDALSSGPPPAAPTTDTKATGRRRWRLPAAAVALVAAGVLTGVFVVQRPPPAGSIAAFQPKTFDRLPITNARFMPDSQTIVYSAASHGLVPEIFVITPNVEGAQPLGLRHSHLLSVSSKGELALIINAKFLEQRLYSGTLARVTLGSSPRAVMERVREADWSPDGESLAVVRDLGNGRDRLEYPIGTALYEATGYLSDVRVSPDGRRVAFFEHPWRYDDRGWVKTVDRSGSVTPLGGEFSGLQGLAWMPDGESLLFSGNLAGGSVLQPMLASAAGTSDPQPFLGVPGRLVVHDVARDGRWLAVREDLWFGVRARVPGHPTERELAWLGSSGARALSADGQLLLMVDVGFAGGRDYGVVLRRTDASQTIRLGTGSAQALSPDGRWASAILSRPPQIVLYPTGVGERLRLPHGAIDNYGSVEWFPDSKRLLVCGSEADRAPRCYEQGLDGSAPKPLTAAGTSASLAPDGRTLLLTLPDGSSQVSDTAGGPARPVAALRADDRRIAWGRDSRSIFVQRGLDVPAVVERLDLQTGQRTMVRELSPEGVSAVMLYVVGWVDDGRWYAYNYTMLPSTLFVVSSGR